MTIKVQTTYYVMYDWSCVYRRIQPRAKVGTFHWKLISHNHPIFSQGCRSQRARPPSQFWADYQLTRSQPGGGCITLLHPPWFSDFPSALFPQDTSGFSCLLIFFYTCYFGFSFRAEINIQARTISIHLMFWVWIKRTQNFQNFISFFNN